MEVITRDLLRHRLSFLRDIRNHKYEQTRNGVYFPRHGGGILVAGQFTSWVNGADMQVDPNVVTAQGINSILNRRFVAGSAAPGYIAAFLNNVTPGDSLTGANFNATLDEWTAYDEANRPAWTLPGATTNKTLSNAAAPAVFTASAVGNVFPLTIWGASIHDGQGKENTDGCDLASKFDTGRILNAAGDKLTLQYDFAGASA